MKFVLALILGLLMSTGCLEPPPAGPDAREGRYTHDPRVVEKVCGRLCLSVQSPDSDCTDICSNTIIELLQCEE